MPTIYAPKKPTVLVVTSFGIPAAGFQVIGETIRGMLRKGFRVVLLTSKPENSPDEVDYDHFFAPYGDALQVVRFKPLLRRWRESLRMPGPLPAKTRRSRGHRKPFQAYSSSHVVPYVESGGALEFLQWLSFTVVAIFHALRLAKREQVSLLYGYGKGVVTASSIGRLLRIPTCTRFFGNIMFPGLDRSTYFLRYPHRTLGLACPADLKIMTNDGTHGDAVLQRLGANPGRIRFWINGVSKNTSTAEAPIASLRSEYNLPEGSRLILTVSRLERLKRVDRAIAAMPRVLGQNTDVILVIVGDGSERPYLEQLAEHLGVSSSVRFIGVIPHPQVHRFLLESDIFLSLYEHTNLCNPVLEALVCGKAIITLDDSLMANLLRNGVNSILVAGDALPDSLSDATLDLLDDRAKLDRLEWNAKDTSTELQTWEERIDMEMQELWSLACGVGQHMSKGSSGVGEAS